MYQKDLIEVSLLIIVCKEELGASPSPVISLLSFAFSGDNKDLLRKIPETCHKLCPASWLHRSLPVPQSGL